MKKQEILRNQLIQKAQQYLKILRTFLNLIETQKICLFTSSFRHRKNPIQNFKKDPIKDDDILAKVAKVLKFKKPLSVVLGYRVAHENIEKKLQTLTNDFQSIKKETY
ncbi:MAG TPA: hypothetical protein PLC42_03730 [Parachlamydiaceae bacterium]|nr:hypothetical protein [Parachlamydiaceae bacterium]